MKFEEPKVLGFKLLTKLMKEVEESGFNSSEMILNLMLEIAILKVMIVSVPEPYGLSGFVFKFQKRIRT